MFPVLKKDIKLFFRDRRSLILVILTPIIIMSLLGNVFKGTTKEAYLKNIGLIVCNEDTRFNLPQYFKAISVEGCKNNAQRLVNEGKARGALLVSKNFSSDIIEGYGSTLTLYVDNSKPQTAFSLATALEAFVNALNENISTTFIREAWQNLRELNAKIKFVAKNLEGTKSSAEQIKEKIANISNVIDVINITKAYEFLDTANNSLSAVRSNLNITNSLNANLTQNNASQGIGLYADKILKELGEFDEIILNSTELLSDLNLSNCNASSKFCDEINSTIQSFRKSFSAILEKNLGITKNIKIIKNNSDELTNEIKRFSNITGNLTYSVYENLEFLDKSISSLYLQVNNLNDIKEDLQGQIKELEALVINFTEQVIRLQGDLNKTSILLDTYTSRKPENIVRAVTINKNDSFINRGNLYFVTPGIMLIVLLLITLLISSSNIVAEKTSVTMLRNIMSPMPLMHFLLQKFIFFIFLCFIQLILMLTVLVFFGVFLPFSIWLVFALLIISIAFVGIGILIGTLTKTENTSLLSSLVIVIPMIFMSGVFFPFESMPRAMNIAGSYLPLSLAIREVENLVIYNIGMDIFVLVLFGLSVVLFFVSAKLIKKANL